MWPVLPLVGSVPIQPCRASVKYTDSSDSGAWLVCWWVQVLPPSVVCRMAPTVLFQVFASAASGMSPTAQPLRQSGKATSSRTVAVSPDDCSVQVGVTGVAAWTGRTVSGITDARTARTRTIDRLFNLSPLVLVESRLTARHRRRRTLVTTATLTAAKAPSRTQA